MIPQTPSPSGRLQSPWIANALLGLAALALALIVLTKPLLGLAVVAAILLGIVVLAAPDVASLAAIFIVYSNIAVVGFRFHGLPKVVGAAVPLLLFIPFFHGLLLRKEKVIATPVLPLLLLLLSVQCLGLLFARDAELAWDNILSFFLEGIVLYFLVTNSVRSGKVLRQATWALLLAGLLMGGIPAFQKATKTYGSDYGGMAQVNTGRGTASTVHERARSSGPIGEKNRYSQIMAMLLPIGVLRLVDERKKALRLLALACTLAIAAGFALAMSRGSAVAMLGVVLILPLLGILSMRHLGWVALGILVMVMALPKYRDRLASIGAVPNLFTAAEPDAQPDGAVRGRLTEMLAAAQVFADHPIIGVGPGMFPLYSQEYGNKFGIRRLAEGREAHSLYFGLPAETGVLGFGALLAVLAITLQRLDRARRRWATERPDVARTAAAFQVAILSYMATSVFLHMAYIRYFFLMLGLAWAAIHVAERALPAPRTRERPHYRFGGLAGRDQAAQ